MKTVYVIGPDFSVREVFHENGWEVVKQMEDADYVCLTGGSDINPELYGQVPHRTTHWIPHRDAYEVDEYHKARGLGKKILGICRGAQLMNALNGGSMYQHVNNHYGHHLLRDLVTGEVREVNSIHHQMMIPCKNSTVIAVSTGHSDQRELMVERDGKHYVQADLGVHDDPEVLIFHNEDGSNFGLGFQGHPEYGHEGATEYFFQLIERYLS